MYICFKSFLQACRIEFISSSIVGINSHIKSSSFRPSHTGMDSYRDSTSVGLRLASTLSSDRGQHNLLIIIYLQWSKIKKNLRIQWLSPLQDEYWYVLFTGILGSTTAVVPHRGRTSKKTTITVHKNDQCT